MQGERMLGAGGLITSVAAERFAYYGFRSIVILFIVEDSGFGLDNAETFNWYTKARWLLAFAFLPMGFLVDLLKERLSLYAGLFMMLMGLVLTTVFSYQPTVFLVGLILLLIGSAIYRPVLMCLLGNQFLNSEDDNEQKSLKMGLLALYMGINIGAFLAALIVGLVASKSSFQLGFGLCAFAMVISALIPSVLWKKIEWRRYQSQIPTPAFKLPDLVKVLLVILVVSVFWGVNELFFSQLYGRADFGEMSLGISLNSLFQSLNPLLLLILTPVLGIVWAVRGFQPPSRHMLLSYLTLLIGVPLCFFLLAYIDKTLLAAFLLFSVIGAVIELFMATSILSVMYQMRQTRWLGTYFGIYYSCVFIVNALVGSFSNSIELSTSAILSSLLIWVVFVLLVLLWRSGLMRIRKLQISEQ